MFVPVAVVKNVLQNTENTNLLKPHEYINTHIYAADNMLPNICARTSKQGWEMLISVGAKGGGAQEMKQEC